MATLKGIKKHCIIEKDCWLWKRSCNQEGYPQVRHGKKVTLTTRTSWELHNNKEFPTGLVAMHTCQNKRCVNPQHIIPSERGKTTIKQRKQIKSINTDKTHREIAREFGLKRSRISQIKAKP